MMICKRIIPKPWPWSRHSLKPVPLPSAPQGYGHDKTSYFRHLNRTGVHLVVHPSAFVVHRCAWGRVGGRCGSNSRKGRGRDQGPWFGSPRGWGGEDGGRRGGGEVIRHDWGGAEGVQREHGGRSGGSHQGHLGISCALPPPIPRAPLPKTLHPPAPLRPAREPPLP
jgi:hypothetical protein